METLTSDCWVNEFGSNSESESIEVPEIDITMLMELLDEAFPEEDEEEDAKLSRFIQSLEVEILPADQLIADSETVEMVDFIDNRSDLDRSMHEFGEDQLLLDWVEMEAMGVGEAHVDACREEDLYGFGGVEGQVYSPLWE